VEISRSFGLKKTSGTSSRTCMSSPATEERSKVKISVFLSSDNDVRLWRAFLEDVNNMLSAGVVPNLYTNDELQQIRDAAKREFKRENPDVTDTPDLVQEYFFNRVKEQVPSLYLHVPRRREFQELLQNVPCTDQQYHD